MKQFINNRAGQRVAVVVENVSERPATELAFVMHGLGGNKEELHLRATIETLLELNYSVVSFDANCTFGESAGKHEDATPTGYYQDLEDVIAWAADQPWYQEHFFLFGHSIGGLTVATYAQNYPDRVKALALLATVVSGVLSAQTPKYSSSELIATWKETGIWTFHGKEKDKPLKWAYFQDLLRYNLLSRVDILTMPTLMIVGTKDPAVPVAHQQLLYAALPEPKEFHIIEGAGHTFAETSERDELSRIVKQWAAR